MNFWHWCLTCCGGEVLPCPDQDIVTTSGGGSQELGRGSRRPEGTDVIDAYDDVWLMIHRWSGIVLAVAVCIHLIVRRNWVFAWHTNERVDDIILRIALFYNGNNPDNLRSGYGPSDFDRTHVLNFTYGYTFPKFMSEDTLAGKVMDGWAIHGIAVIQSGQPYSMIDYSGSCGQHFFYSTFNGITNPIVLRASGCNRKNALTGQNGAFYNVNTGQGAALKASSLTLPLVPQGTMGVPNGDTYETNFISGERNIFRQSWQRRADASLVKDWMIHEPYTLHYTFDVTT